MRKITSMLFAFFVFAFSWQNNAQCDFDGNQYPSSAITANNDGSVYNISTCNFFGEYAVLQGMNLGDNYQFSDDGGYITVIDLADGSTVLAHGMSPLDWTATVADVELHWAADAACGTDSSCHTTTYQNLSVTCFPVTGIMVSNIMQTSADVSWTAGDTETAWEYVVQAAGTGTPTGAGTAATATTVNVSGLTAQTDYEVYVRADCTGGDYGEWVGPVSFTSSCDALMAPYTQDFENAGSIPNCWAMSGSENWLFSTSGGHVGNAGTITGTTASGNYFAYVDDSTPDNVGTTLLSPFVDVSGLTTPALTFYEISDNEGNSNVTLTVDVWDGAAWNNVGVYNTNTAGWELKIIDLSGLTISGPVQARFVVDETVASDFYDDVAIDDVSFDELPSCIMPGAPVVDATTDVSVDFSWTAGDTETAWEYVVQVAGTGTPAGAGTAASAAMASESGLTPETDYEIYVRADCGANGFSDWSGPTSFTTDCAAVMAPYMQDFETFTVSSSAFASENCWTATNIGGYLWEVAANTDTSSTGTGPASGVSDGNYLFTESSSGSMGDAIDFVSPSVDLSPLTTPALSFDYHMFGANMGTLEVIVFDGTTSTTEATIAGQQQTAESDPFVTYIVDLSAYAGQTVQVTFRGIRGSDYTSDISLDNVSFDEAPSCLPPTNISVDVVTDATVDFSWLAGSSETAWEYVVQPAGTGMPTGSGTAVSALMASESGLLAVTDYEIYVRSDCGANGFSDWTGPVSFTTLCSAFTGAYTADFTTIAPACWSEGNDTDIATGPDGNNGAWLNDDFLNDSASGVEAARINLYNLGDSDWLVSPTFDFSAGGYGLAFDVGVTAFASMNAETPNLMGSDDEVQVLMSEDNGATWTNLETFNVANAPSHLGEARLYDLTATTSSTVKFAFWATEGTVDDAEDVDFFVANFTVDDYTTLGVNSVEFTGFKFYPNPVNNTLSLRSLNTIDNVSIYNMIGQEVINVPVNTMSKDIDMSSLSTGNYFVRVSINGAVENFKIIKQ